MRKIKSEPGFRIDLIDIILMSSGILVSSLLGYFIHLNLGIMIAYLIMSIFLFCNVFRVGVLELIWAFFVVLSIICSVIFNIDPLILVMIIGVLTQVTCVILGIYLGWYQGIFASSFLKVFNHKVEDVKFKRSHDLELLPLPLSIKKFIKSKFGHGYVENG